MAKQEKTAIAKRRFSDSASLVAAIKKQFGDGSVMIGSQPIIDVPSISTGALSLDRALGVWGIPRGRVVEIYGPESSGKTTLALSIIAQCQKAGHMAAFVDAENALDTIWAKNLGVDVDNLLISQPDNGEQALEIVEMFAYSGQVKVIVVDSVAALVPQAEIDSPMGQQAIGLQARLMSQAMRKLVAAANKNDCIIIFINQIRMKIGVMFGNPETTPGGNALKFYSSVRLDIRRTGSVKEGDVIIGNNVRISVKKNKVAPPFKTAEFVIYFGLNDYPYGIDYVSSMIDMAVELGFVQRAGSWYNYGEIRLGMGHANACQLLRTNPDMASEIEMKIKEFYSKQLVLVPPNDQQSDIIEGPVVEDSFIEDSDDGFEEES